MSQLGPRGVTESGQPSPSGAALWRRLRSRFDWPLFLTIVAIVAVGLANLYSASRYAPQRGFSSQCGWIAMGVAAYVATCLIDYHVWRRFAWAFLLLGGVAVIAVHFAGIEVNGSRRWLGWGGLRVQPSEFIKLAVIMVLARFVQDRGAQVSAPLPLASHGLAFGGTFCLIAWQPDLGTATLVAFIVVSVALLVARKLWPLLVGLGVVCASAPILWMFALRPYQKQRFLCLDPSADPSKSCYHVLQSIFAIGAGRVSGKGYMRGTQNQLNFVPEQTTDFPYSVLCEEWGFVGAIVLIGLYLFLILWILNVASQARDRFGATLCVGVGAMVFWHVLVNIGMVTGIMPVVGVTLPLVSYGGSSAMVMFMGLGLVASVSLRK